MSGFEIAGAVLGGIPLIISALENYKKVVEIGRIWRHSTSNVLVLTSELNIERVILQNTCELLLDEITTNEKVCIMTNEPLGSLWRSSDISDRVAARVGGGESLAAFRQTLESMQETTNQFRAKLREVEISGTLSVARSSFVLSQEECAKLIDGLRKNNTRLSELVDKSKPLELSRRIRSQCHLVDLARSLTKGLFAALRSTFTCTCSVSHGINFQLCAFPANLIAHGDEEVAARKMTFQLALSFDPDNIGRVDAPWLRELITLQLINDKIAPTPAITPSEQPLSSTQKLVERARPTPTANENQQQLRMERTGIGQSVRFTAALPMAIGMRANESSAENNAIGVDDLCGAIAKGQDRHNVNCYGHICDTSIVTGHTFGVYPDEKLSATPWTVVSLKDVLEDQGRTLPRLRFRHKARLSHLIALSTLQLSSSPWMPKVLTSRDIIFLRRDSNVSYDSVYIASRLPFSSPQRPAAHDARVSAFVENEELFFLGILLIELALEFSVKLPSSTARKHHTRPRNLEAADWAMAIEALSKLESPICATPNYFRSVKACIKCEFFHNNIDLNDQRFREEVYQKVISPLEKDLSPLSF